MNDLTENLKHPVFIVSTGRCGSTMLSRLLAIHPSLFVFNQYPSLRTEAFVNWSAPGKIKLIEKRLRKKRDELIASVRRNRFIYVENSTSAAFLMDELYRLFDAKFIFISRDGKDFLRSGMSREWYKPETVINRIKTWLRRKFFIQTGRDTSDTLLIPPGKYRTRFDRIAWRWAEVNGIILDRLSSIPNDRKLMIKLEELNKESLVAIHDFLGIHVDDPLIEEMLKIANTRPNKTGKYDFPPHTEWPEREIQRFNEIAGDIMKKLGYSA